MNIALRPIRHAVLALTGATLATLAITAPAAAKTPAACVAQAKHVVPFEAADVVRGADGRLTVSWRAPAPAGPVAVYASKSADGADGVRVGQGAAAGSLTVTPPGPAPRWYLALRPACGAQLVVADRRLVLDGAPNFRDAGGYRTADGRWVRMGALYRADELSHLSDRDLTELQAIGIRTVADLRTEQERKSQPDKIPAQATHAVYDVSGAKPIDGVVRESFGKLVKEGRTEQVLVEANRQFINNPAADEAYNKLMTQIAKGDGATVFHCTAGKDRTGWANAVFLTILGVPRETVMQDYLLSAELLKAKNKVLLQHMKAVPGFENVSPEQMENVLTVRPEYLQAAFDEVEKKYGSFDAYVRDGLRLTDADVAALRARYLIGAPAAG